jgi:hypothetical protein
MADGSSIMVFLGYEGNQAVGPMLNECTFASLLDFCFESHELFRDDSQVFYFTREVNGKIHEIRGDDALEVIKSEDLTELDLWLKSNHGRILKVADPSSVHDFAYFEDVNKFNRPYMEDMYSINDRLGGNPKCGLFCIFDGHGGDAVSKYCASDLHQWIEEETRHSYANMSSTLEQCFLNFDKEIK